MEEASVASRHLSASPLLLCEAFADCRAEGLAHWVTARLRYSKHRKLLCSELVRLLSGQCTHRLRWIGWQGDHGVT